MKFFKLNLRKIPVLLSNSVGQSLPNLKKVQNFKKSTFKGDVVWKEGHLQLCNEIYYLLQ
jgi:hypothetical protein